MRLNAGMMTADRQNLAAGELLRKRKAHTPLTMQMGALRFTGKFEFWGEITRALNEHLRGLQNREQKSVRRKSP
jgi:hypothetical protein